MNRVAPVARTSENVVAERTALLGEVFPECVTEGRIDFEKLRVALGGEVDARPERYLFTWAGKRDAIRLLQTPSRATLIPMPDESISFGATDNIFIEGENLEALKLLYKSYFGRVKVIYIDDPPYNTGNDFIYLDNYGDPLDTYLKLTGQKDADGNLLTTNPETSGRFHSIWLSMMYPRLFVARQLLREDGAIFVSIDDSEAHNLRMILDEIFGQENFVATFVWEKRTTRENRRVFSFNHDFILCYARSRVRFQVSRRMLPMSEQALKRYENPDNDPRGDWQSVSLNAQAGHATPAQFYQIVTPSGRVVDPPPGRCWAVTKERFQELRTDGRVWFGKDEDNVPREKVFLSEANGGLTPHTLWKAEEVGTTDTGKKALLELFGGQAVFDTPKPVELMKRILNVATDPKNREIVLDFFSGTASMAQAVVERNREDGGNRHFIMIQLPEPTRRQSQDGSWEESDAWKAGYQTIAAIGRERIRRAIAKIRRSDSQGELKLMGRETAEDLGFRVFTLAQSNYRPWAGVEQRQPEEYEKTMAMYTDALIDGWQPENVIWEVAIKEAGFGLNARIESMAEPKRCKAYKVTDPDKEQSFIISLDREVSLDALKALNLGSDDLFICRDRALDDSAAANLALQCRLKTI